MKQTVKFKKLTPNAIVPTYGTEFSAGADLYSGMTEPVIINAGTTEFIKTGIAMEIPEGLVGLVYARSGMACKKGLAPANKVGVIDSDYRGELMVGIVPRALALQQTIKSVMCPAISCRAGSPDHATLPI